MGAGVQEPVDDPVPDHCFGVCSVGRGFDVEAAVRQLDLNRDGALIPNRARDGGGRVGLAGPSLCDDLLKSVPEEIGTEHVEAEVDFSDGLRCEIGIAKLDDATELSVAITHHASHPCRLFDDGGRDHGVGGSLTQQWPNLGGAEQG